MVLPIPSDMVEKHIKRLLQDHDCVIIPDFGGLITHYAPAKVHPVKHTFSPPSKRIAFNEKLKLNDGLLINTLIHAQNLKAEEGQQLVYNFVGHLKSELTSNKKFELKGVGIFRYNAEQKIEFQYVEGENFLSDSFGLPELMAKPVLQPESVVLRTLKPKERPVAAAAGKSRLRQLANQYYGVAASLVIGSLTMSAVYFLSLQTDYNLGSLNPVSVFNEAPAAKPTLSENAISEQIYFTEEDQRNFGKTIAPVYTAAEPEAEQTPTIYDADTVETNLTENVAETESPETSLPEPVAAKPVVAKPKTARVKSEAVVANINRTEDVMASVVKSKTSRFYIIVGGYTTLLNAEQTRARLVKKENDVKIILPPTEKDLHRVSVADFNDPASAQKQLQKYRKIYGNSVWVLNY